MPRREHLDALWRDTLQRLDLTEALYAIAWEILSELRAADTEPLPEDEEHPLDIIGDVLTQVPHLVARIRELEGQLAAYQHVERADPTRRRPPAPEQDTVSQVPPDW